VHFLRRGDMVDSLRIGWSCPAVRDRLTILVIVGTFLKEPSRNRIRIRLFIRTVKKNL